MAAPKQQTVLPGTLPTLRTARAEWEGAFAELEEVEDAIDAEAEIMKGLKERRALAEETFRRRSNVLRQVMALNRQEVLDDVIDPPETE